MLGNEMGDQLCVVSLNIARNGPETRLTCVPSSVALKKKIKQVVYL